MKLEQTKLEELTYLSLIGKFEYVCKANFNTMLCFSADSKEKGIKPLYITNVNEQVSNKILLARINSFEEKVFGQIVDEKELNYSKRIKHFVSKMDKYSLKNAMNNLASNLYSLEKEEILNKNEKESLVTYLFVSELSKKEENIH